MCCRCLPLPPPPEQVQKDLEYFPLEVTAGPNGECLYQVSWAALTQLAACACCCCPLVAGALLYCVVAGVCGEQLWCCLPHVTAL